MSHYNAEEHDCSNPNDNRCHPKKIKHKVLCLAFSAASSKLLQKRNTLATVIIIVNDRKSFDLIR